MMTNEQVLQKMEEDFVLRGSAENTKESYLTAQRLFSEFAGKERLADLNQDDLRAYLLNMHYEGVLQGTSINAYNAGCKFLLKVVLNLDIDDGQVPNVRARHKLPIHFRVEQLIRFFTYFNDIKDFAFFLTLYGTGMRISELGRMKYTDVDTDEASGLRFLMIPNAKRNKERKVILPEACYHALRHYWAKYRPETPEIWMFPAKRKIGSLKCNVNSYDFKTCLNRSGLSSEFHPHSLRHSHSCHTIQNDLNSILKLKYTLGHSSLQSTEIYLNLSMIDTTNTKHPSEICEILWEEYKARHVVTKTF